MTNAELRERDLEQERLKDQRLSEQKESSDYSYEKDGAMEICDNCKSPINSHGHCPLCGY